MEELFLHIEHFFEQWGLYAVFFGVMLEDFGVPAPGESLLIAAALVARGGSPPILLVLLAGWLGAVIGDNIGYVIGRYGGRRLILRYGRYVRLSGRVLKTAERFFDKYGPGIVVVARFIEGLRQLNGVLAGIDRMRWKRFLLFNCVGAALWTGFWSVTAYVLGTKIQLLFTFWHRHLLWLWVGLGVVLAVVGVIVVMRRRRR